MIRFTHHGRVPMWMLGLGGLIWTGCNKPQADPVTPGSTESARISTTSVRARPQPSTRIPEAEPRPEPQPNGGVSDASPVGSSGDAAPEGEATEETPAEA